MLKSSTYQKKMKTKMKTIHIKLIAIIGFAFFTLQTNAQIDRSKMPTPGPEPEINLEKPTEFKLKNGITVLVVENNKLPRVSYQLSIDNKPYVEGNKAGVANLLSSMLGNGTTSISKEDFNEEVDFLGANINFGSSGGFGSGLVKYSDRIVELMADATMNPLLTEEEFIKEKDKLIEGLKADEKSVDAASSRVVSALAYGKDHAFGEFVTEETVNNVTFQDVKDFYKLRFAPNNAYIVVIGDIDVKTAKKQLKKFFGKWEKIENLPSLEDPKLTPNVTATEINFVDMPNATQSSISVTNNVDLKQNSPDYFAALMANNILGGGGEGYLFKNLREDKAYTYGAYSSLRASRYGVSRFNASAKVRNAVTDSAVVEFLKEIKRIRTEPVNEVTLKNAKTKYVGNFVMALERPQTIANYALNIKRKNLPEDYYSKYLENINNVSVEDVNQAAKKYMSLDQSRIVIVGKGSEVLENLSKTGIPISYYTKYADPTEKPKQKALAADITVKSVIDNYFNAIGGYENAKKVASVTASYNTEIQGMALNMKTYQMQPKNFKMEMSMMGNVMQKQVFNGSAGYTEAQGQKMPMGEDELTKMKNSSQPFEEFGILETGTLSGIEEVNGSSAYVIKVNENETNYYDVETGLKVRKLTTTNAPNGNVMEQPVDYSEYKAVNGVKFPYNMKMKMGPMNIELKAEKVEVNSNLTANDFE